MKRYNITSPSFAGEINVLYGEGKLMYIDFLKCELSDTQMSYFKDRLPVTLEPENSETLLTFFGVSKLNIAEEGYFVSFEQFWTRYNLKRNRERCEKLWAKLSEADRTNAYFKLGQYERHLSLNPWKTKSDPDTYLRNKYWNNDYKN